MNPANPPGRGLATAGLLGVVAEPNIYYTQQRNAYILVYVDDLSYLAKKQQ